MNKLLRDTMDLVDFIRVSGESENVGDLVKEFINFLSSFGVNRFFMVDLMSGDPSGIEKRINVMASYPESEIRNSFRKRREDYTPVCNNAFRTGMPVLWDDVRFEDDGRILFSNFSRSDPPALCKGFGITINHPLGRIIGMAFVGLEKGVSCDRYTLSLVQAASYQFCIVYTLLNGSCLAGNNIRITSREKEILLWIANGKSKSETAEMLSISESAVKRHCENIFLKLGVNTLPSAVAKAFKLGLINPLLSVFFLCWSSGQLTGFLFL